MGTKEKYLSPSVETIEIENEGSVMTGSDKENAGKYKPGGGKPNPFTIQISGDIIKDILK